MAPSEQTDMALSDLAGSIFGGSAASSGDLDLSFWPLLGGFVDLESTVRGDEDGDSSEFGS